MNDAQSRLDLVLAGIAGSARLARRQPADITLVAVSKSRDAEAIEPLIASGQRDFGESRVQEATAKWPAILDRHPDVRLHHIGRLQSNKCAEAVRLYDVIHSLDRLSLVESIAAEAFKAGRSPKVFVQVNIGSEPQKGGCAIDSVPDIVEAVRSSELELLGLMAIPPLDHEPAPYFALLSKLAKREGLAGLSMGMSADYESAVMLGATVVRVGSALFEDE